MYFYTLKLNRKETVLECLVSFVLLKFLGLILSVVHLKWRLFTTHLGVFHHSKWRVLPFIIHKHILSLYFFFPFIFYAIVFHLCSLIPLSFGHHLIISILCCSKFCNSSFSPYNCVFSFTLYKRTFTLT